MRIPQKQQAFERYNSLKSTLQQAAQKPSNDALFSKNGDRVELNQSVSFPFEGEKIVVKKGSAFDNDIKTPDKISLESSREGVTQSDTFEHFSERKGLIFKRDQEMLKVTYSESQAGGWSSNSATFEI